MSVTFFQINTAEALRLARGAASPLEPWVERADAVVIAKDLRAPDDEILSGRDRSLNASVVAAALLARFPAARVIVQADLARDYPYNLARRVASLAALATSGVGVLLERTSSLFTVGSCASGESWDVADITDDGALVLAKLWQSWPTDSIIADREARRFVDASRIRRVAHHGIFQVEGPLQTPVDAASLPVIVQRVSSSDPTLVVEGGVFVAVTDADDPLAIDSGRWIYITGDPERVAAAVAARSVAGAVSERTDGTLRDRLLLAKPPELLEGAPTAFVKEQW